MHQFKTIIDAKVWTSRNAPLSSLALMICFCCCYYATPALFKSNKQYPYLIHYVVYCDVCVVSVLVQSGVAIEPWMDGNAGGNAGIVPVGG